MQLLVITDEYLKEELCSSATPGNCTFIHDPASAGQNADVVIDLLFQTDPERIAQLKKLGSLVMINSVAQTLSDTDPSFIRINGWPTFLKSDIIEVAGPVSLQQRAEAAFACFNKFVRWVPDTAGFVTPRVISMIINEAFMALAEGVSTREEIDTAMKLGTNYPYGPFEWCDRIGKEKVDALLQQLSKNRQRYQSYIK